MSRSKISCRAIISGTYSSASQSSTNSLINATIKTSRSSYITTESNSSSSLQFISSTSITSNTSLSRMYMVRSGISRLSTNRCSTSYLRSSSTGTRNGRLIAQIIVISGSSNSGKRGFIGNPTPRYGRSSTCSKDSESSFSTKLGLICYIIH